METTGQSVFLATGMEDPGELAEVEETSRLRFVEGVGTCLSRRLYRVTAFGADGAKVGAATIYAGTAEGAREDMRVRCARIGIATANFKVVAR